MQPQTKIKTQNTTTIPPQQLNSFPSICQTVVFLPLAIPASGKSTQFTLIKKYFDSLGQSYQLTQLQRQKQKQQIRKDDIRFKNKYYVEIVSSDSIRGQKMDLLVKEKNISKKEAYLICKTEADTQFYRLLDQILTKIQNRAKNSDNKTRNLMFMDKNYSKFTLPVSLLYFTNIISKHINKNHQIKLSFITQKAPQQKMLILPKTKEKYPFQISYVACCLKRVLLRKKHETLEGTDAYRIGTCLGWVNNFRNFSIPTQIKQVSHSININFTKHQQVPSQMAFLILKILEDSTPNQFRQYQHRDMPKLVELLTEWKNQEYQVAEEQGGNLASFLMRFLRRIMHEVCPYNLKRDHWKKPVIKHLK